MDAKSILKQHGLRPSKGLGQNFLVDKGVIRRIIEAADLQPDDIVLEIGPGLGALTQELAKKAKKVVAVEKDPRMVGVLKEMLSGFNNVELVQGDVLKIGNWKLIVPTLSRILDKIGKNWKLKIENYKVVGNLPFYLTAPVIRQFLELIEAKPQSMVFVVQKEVAQRVCAKPPRMNLLAVSVQVYAEPKIIDYISKRSFWPRPEVDAAILKIIYRSQTSSKIKAEVGLPNMDLFFKVVKAGFSQPRKQLANNLSKKLEMSKDKAGEWLLKNGIQPTQRAETLNLEDWTRLAGSASEFHSKYSL